MSPALRRYGGTVLVALLVAFAYSPLLAAGFVGEDYRILARAQGPVERLGAEGEPAPLWRLSGDDFYRVEGAGGSFLPGLSLAVSMRLWGRGEPGTNGLGVARSYRLENLVLLALGSWAILAFVRRLLVPWTGSDHAAAAGRASALLLLVHPLAYASVGALAGRGPLLSLAFGAWCAALFLRGRQDRELPLTLLASLLAVLASLSSEWALALPLVLGAAELVSAHRYRPLRVRVRTALTATVVCAAAVAACPLGRSWYTGEAPVPGLRSVIDELFVQGRWTEAAIAGLEKLGVLLLPASAHTSGLAGTALAGALFLLVLQPVLLAARSAPKLWGWLLFWWMAALGLAWLPGATQRVFPQDLSEARVLLSGCAILAVGLGVASTARSGPWRNALPVVLALGYALLGRGNALPWVDAATSVGQLAADVEAARELEGREHRIAVIDPPEKVQGVYGVADALPWVLGLAPEAGGPGSGPWRGRGHGLGNGPADRSAEDLPQVLGLSLDAFLALAREREFDALRRAGALVIYPAEAAGGSAQEKRSFVRLTGGEPSTGPRHWRGDARSPDLDWDPGRARALRVIAPAETDISQPRAVSWRAQEASVRHGSAVGAWIASGPPPEAFFDLSGSLAWLLGGRIRRVWFEEGLPTVERAEVLEELPGLASGLEPDPQDADWYFPDPSSGPSSDPSSGPSSGPVDFDHPRGRWVVGLLELGRFRYRELPVERGPGGTLRVPDAAGLVSQSVRETGAAVAWTLDYRIDDVTVARARGRRVGVRGSREENPDPGGPRPGDSSSGGADRAGSSPGR